MKRTFLFLLALSIFVCTGCVGKSVKSLSPNWASEVKISLAHYFKDGVVFKSEGVDSINILGEPKPCILQPYGWEMYCGTAVIQNNEIGFFYGTFNGENRAGVLNYNERGYYKAGTATAIRVPQLP